MIVKNEENSLETCLDAISSYMDEIIIVDTGSTDKTKEIALKYSDKVYDYQWGNDFAAARNFSISKAANEYILVLDSDETVISMNMAEVKQLMTNFPCKIGRILRSNEYSRENNHYKYIERVNRLFSRKIYKYEGIIHEQLVYIDDNQESASDTYNIPITVHHSGYEGNLNHRKQKTQRNISLLKIALESRPNDPYLQYQLGKSYYMQEDYLSACDYFRLALSCDLNPRLEYVQDMVESYGYSLINSGQYESAMQLLNVYDEFAVTADFVFMIALVLMNNGQFENAITEFENATRMSVYKMEGVNTYLAFYNIGAIHECLGNIQSAVEYYGKCIDYDQALLRLGKLLGEKG
jgi:glycosyltransferase involved in cell wall biosynthesis